MALLTWVLRDSLDPTVWRAIPVGNAVQDSLLGIVVTHGILTGVVNAWCWALVAIFGSGYAGTGSCARRWCGRVMRDEASVSGK